MPMRYPISFLLFPFCCAASWGQLATPSEKPALGPRMPALSADGTQVAFVWRGDIWVASTSGGNAYPVTSHVEYDAYPVFSPDGQWIAFMSNRSGSTDIWVVPTRGGRARQLTTAGGREVPTDWSPDGKSLLFVSQRDTVHDTVFSLDVKTLRFTKLTEDYKTLLRPAFSPDGAQITFERNSGFPWTRPRYHGSGAAQLWTMDLKTGQRKSLADDERQHLYPRFLPEGKGIVCVTYSEETPSATVLGKPPVKWEDSAKKTPNLYLYPAEGGKPRQLTHFVGGAVRFPTVARKSGDIVFEYEDSLYLLKPGAKDPIKLTFSCGADDKLNTQQRQVITSAEVEESEISPDGKTFAFLVRNELWTIPLEKPKGRNADDATRLTNYPGFDRDFTWSRDAKTLFFISDRDGADHLFALDVATQAVQPVWAGKSDAKSPRLSPDGMLLGFWVEGKEEEGGGLYTIPADLSAPMKRILTIPGNAQGEFSWSPDQQWLAYTKSSRESNGVNLWITKADGTGGPVNVTRLNAFHSQPTWSPDGKYLYFQSSRDGSGGLWVLPLTREEARTDELELKYTKPTAPVKVVIDFEDIHYRLRKLSTQNPEGSLQASEVDGVLYYISGGSLWLTSYDGKDTRSLTGGGIANLRVNAAGDTATFHRGGQLFTFKLKVPGAQPALVSFRAVVLQDQRATRQVAFTQLWHAFNNRFYDPNFHGRDFVALRQRYEPLLDAVGTREEMANLGNLMLGELEASHSEVGPAPGTIVGPQTYSLGVYFDYSYVGPGIRVKDVPKRAPGSYEKTRIKPGEYIVAVDGVEVTLDENLYKVLNDKGDRDFVLLVNDKPVREGARTVTYKALTGGEWSALHYRNRIDARSKLVEQKSGGKVGYVHIAGMGGGDRELFAREFYEYAEGKDAMVIDVRENGGGNIGDTLVSWLLVKPYSVNVPRSGYPSGAPFGLGRQAWDKPIVVLMGDSSFSNAEMFPYSMRINGLAKLVGVPTPGYVIGTNGLPLVDGTSARMPFIGVYRKDGTSLENMGERPDYLVPWSNDDYFRGKDPQLEKAIELLVKK